MVDVWSFCNTLCCHIVFKKERVGWWCCVVLLSAVVFDLSREVGALGSSLLQIRPHPIHRILQRLQLQKKIRNDLLKHCNVVNFNFYDRVAL